METVENLRSRTGGKGTAREDQGSQQDIDRKGAELHRRDLQMSKNAMRCFNQGRRGEP
jgi:hypothetical protein